MSDFHLTPYAKAVMLLPEEAAALEAEIGKFRTIRAPYVNRIDAVRFALRCHTQDLPFLRVKPM